jgi:hypothetical protein
MASVKAFEAPTVAQIQRWMDTYSQQILMRIYGQFPTGQLARKFGNVRKTLTFPVWDKTNKIIRGYIPKPDARQHFKLTEIQLEAYKFYMKFLIINMDDDMEALQSRFQDANQNVGNLSDDEWGMRFMLWLIDQAMGTTPEEYEEAVWMAIADPLAAADDLMYKKFNGLRRQAATFATTGSGTVVTTGSINAGNAIEKVELMYQSLDKQLKKRGSLTFCSFNLFDNYKLNYRDDNRQNPEVLNLDGEPYSRLPIYLGNGNHFLVATEGIGDDDALITTTPDNIAICDDSLGTPWHIDKEDFCITALKGLKFGTTFLNRRPGYLLVNDRLVDTEITTPRVNI